MNKTIRWLAYAWLLAVPLCAIAQEPPQKAEVTYEELLKHVHPDVRYERVTLPGAENAFLLWEQALDTYVAPDGPVLLQAHQQALDEDAAFPQGVPGQRLAEWLGRNREASDLLDKGIALGKCQFPEVEGPETPLPRLAGLRELARMELLRAKMLASWGDFDAAGDEIAGVVRFGELTNDGEGVLIAYLVGEAIQSVGLRGAQWLARQPEAPQAPIERLLQSIAPSPRSADALARTLRVEACGFFVKGIGDLASGDPVQKLAALAGEQDPAESDALAALFKDRQDLLDAGKTTEQGSGYFARMIKNTKLSWHDQDRTIRADMEEQARRLRAEFEAIPGFGGGEGFSQISDAERARIRAALAKVENPIGGMLLAMLMPAMDRIAELSFQARTEREAVRALLAIRIFELRQGRLPASLDEVVKEKILPGAPADFYSGQPLHYSAEKRLLWSVGPDEVDDGGQGAPYPDRKGPDYVWPVLAVQER